MHLIILTKDYAIVIIDIDYHFRYYNRGYFDSI